MCGICAAVGTSNQLKNVLSGLGQLEYRGYDSSGVAFLQNNKICVCKCVGGVKNLEKKLTSEFFDALDNNSSSTVIGHTRWATHGQVSWQNAHPHVSANGKFAMVHNGIVENFTSLCKQFDIKNLKSQTDTEVFVNLVEKFSYNQKNLKKESTGRKKNVSTRQNLLHEKTSFNDISQPLQWLMEAAAQVKGSYAVALLGADFEDEIYLAKNGSPLMIAVENGVGMAASDLGVFCGKFSECFVLDDGEFAILSSSKLQIFDKNGNVVKKSGIKLEDICFSEEKTDEKFFMKKEIKEQPLVLRQTYFKYFLENVVSTQDLQNLKKFKTFQFVACGTAYHAALLGAQFLQKVCKKQAWATVASEFRYSQPILHKNCLYVFVSQSGETADTIACAKMVKDLGFCTMCVTNVPYCSLNKLADFVLPTFAGREVAVASTKAYTAQVFTLLVFALLLCNKQKQNAVEKLKNFACSFQVEKLQAHFVCNKPEKVFCGPQFSATQSQAPHALCKPQLSARQIQTLTTLCGPELSATKIQTPHALCETNQMAPTKDDDISKTIMRFKKIFFIGRGQDYVTALEAALKLKEIAYIGCIGIAAGELKHGTLALVDDDTLVVAICTQSALKEKMESNIREVQARGGKVLVLGQFKLSVEAEFYIDLPNFDEMFMPVASIVPLQQLAFEFSTFLGYNPDKPRNLAKSVTVE